MRVRLRGVVTYPNSRRVHFFLQDATGGMVVYVSDTNLCPEFGQEVEAEGIVVESNGITGVNASTVRVLGPGTLPTPRRVAVGDAGGVRYYAQWVEVEGTVLQARTNTSGALAVHITDGQDWAVCVLSEVPSTLPLDLMSGARIRLQGVNTGPTSSAILTKRADLLTLLTAGRSNPFGAPIANVPALIQEGKVSGERVQLRATVLESAREGTVFLRHEAIPFQADFLYPFPMKEGEWTAPRGIPVIRLRRGDVVELVGSPNVSKGQLRMRFCEMRFLRSGDEPEPLRVDAATVLSGRVGNDLVAVQGRLVDYTHVLVSGRWFETLRLESRGTVLDAFFESTRSNHLASLKRDDLIEATGIVQPEEGVPPFRLRIRTVNDVRSLGLAPSVSRMRRLRTTSIVGGIMLLATAWIVFLRVRLARERQLAVERSRADVAVRELNTSLEKRVAERTAELERAKEELRLALNAERELSELKTRFVALVSHEFRTPLGITMSAVELLRNYADRLPPVKARELLQDIYSSTLRMSGLMEQVLLLGRVEAGKIGFQRAPLDLTNFGARLVDETLSASNHRCPVNFHGKGDLAGAVGDGSLLHHIFSNLLSNAVKYSPNGRGVEFSVRREGDDAVFTVRDHGIGIPEADRGRLFEAFHRASNVGQTPGTGLGLLIVKRCVELHEGNITFESRENEGTTFTVRLPLFAARSEQTETQPGILITE
jgi:signal transduction histidine kinase